MGVSYMKKVFVLLFFILVFGFFLIGCTNKKEVNNNDNKEENVDISHKSIVIYFSRTNNTEKIANYIVELTNSDSYEIIAKIPYTDEDIKYYTNCRADNEQKELLAAVSFLIYPQSL